MIEQLRTLFRFRLLIESLVARELKARYRGSVLGFFWSFVNPLLLLLVYVAVFTVILPGSHRASLEPYALFLFCGILPGASSPPPCSSPRECSSRGAT
jgi:ABC-type polysaccharide/polyol phosphate export permease